MQMGSEPDPRWVEWAEAECVRRLTISLAEIKERKKLKETEELERSFSSWQPEEPQLQEVRTPAQTLRVIRIHAENLQSV